MSDVLNMVDVARDRLDTALQQHYQSGLALLNEMLSIPRGLYQALSDLRERTIAKRLEEVPDPRAFTNIAGRNSFTVSGEDGQTSSPLVTIRLIDVLDGNEYSVNLLDRHLLTEEVPRDQAKDLEFLTVAVRTQRPSDGHFPPKQPPAISLEDVQKVVLDHWTEVVGPQSESILHPANRYPNIDVVLMFLQLLQENELVYRDVVHMRSQQNATVCVYVRGTIGALDFEFAVDGWRMVGPWSRALAKFHHYDETSDNHE